MSGPPLPRAQARGRLLLLCLRRVLHGSADVQPGLTERGVGGVQVESRKPGLKPSPRVYPGELVKSGLRLLPPFPACLGDWRQGVNLVSLLWPPASDGS